MKKILTAIIAIIYLGVSTGVAMNVHYCMGKISSVDLYGNTKDKCGKCGMKNGHGKCCNDLFKIVKIDDTHKLIANDIVIEAPLAIIPVSQTHTFSSIIFDQQIPAAANNSPPLSGRQICISNCIYRL